MMTEQKVALVETAWETYGLNRTLAATDLPKSTWHYHRTRKVGYEDKYARLWPELEEIARQHPEYGILRTTAELRDHYGCQVNHKVIQRLHQLWDLRLLRSTRKPKPSKVRQAIVEAGERANLVALLEQIELFQVAYTDFTELLYANGKHKAHLMPIIDHVCKLVYGWAVGEGPDAQVALQAWERTKETCRQLDIPYNGMIVHHDQGSAFISYAWTGQLLLKDDVRLSYALRGFKDNPEMESFIGHFKEEGRSLFLDAQNIAELTTVVDNQMVYYNANRRHSSIGYMPPLTYIEQVRAGSATGSALGPWARYRE
jgi:transposase InsO family protein